MMSQVAQKLTFHDTTVDRQSTVAPVPHLTQRESWDCGLTSVAMVCSFVSPRAFPPAMAYEQVRAVWGSPEFLDKETGDEVKSVWTIDLQFLIHSLIKQFLGSEDPLLRDTMPMVDFYTTQAGVNEAYGKLSFYSKEFDADTLRVQKRFEVASELKYSVHVRKAKTTEMIADLQKGNCVFIVLVDARRLRCPCRGAAAVVDSCCSCCCKCFCCGCGDGALPYFGHYIVVCGYNRFRKLLLYRNPASSGTGLCSEDWETFDDARSAEGTDNDVIRVCMPDV